MELRQLRYFVVLAEELSFTRAAERLHISQPPLSLQVAQLENELGVKLFERTSRRVELTEPGQVFLADVRAVLGRLKDATARVRAVDLGLAGRIEIGLSGSHFLGPLSTLIAAHERSHPDVAIVLNEMSPADQLEALREHRIDLSISRTAIEDELLTSALLWPDPVIVALPPGHRLAAFSRISGAELADERFVVLRRETSTFAQSVLDYLSQDGVMPEISQTVSEIPAQLYLVAAGLGIALVPQSVCRRFTEIVYRPLRRRLETADVHAVTHRHSRNRALVSFIEAAKAWRDEVPALPAETPP